MTYNTGQESVLKTSKTIFTFLWNGSDLISVRNLGFLGLTLTPASAFSASSSCLGISCKEKVPNLYGPGIVCNAIPASVNYECHLPVSLGYLYSAP